MLKFNLCGKQRPSLASISWMEVTLWKWHSGSDIDNVVPIALFTQILFQIGSVYDAKPSVEKVCYIENLNFCWLQQNSLMKFCTPQDTPKDMRKGRSTSRSRSRSRSRSPRRRSYERSRSRSPRRRSYERSRSRSRSPAVEKEDWFFSHAVYQRFCPMLTKGADMFSCFNVVLLWWKFVCWCIMEITYCM